MNSESNQNFFETLEQSHSVLLSIDNLQKGIDNYHIDVRLSKKFSSDVKKLVGMLVSQVAVPKPKHWDNTSLFDKLRASYLDMMTVLIHRAKTDLGPDDICLLQFAPIKFVLTNVRSQLDTDVKNLSSRLTEHRNKGSSEALATDQRLFWLKKNYDSILFSVNKQIFSQLQKVEDRQLNVVRDQYLGEDYQFTVEALMNSQLFVSDLSALPLLINEYSMWSWNSEDSGFIELNNQLETLLNRRLQHLHVEPLRPLEDQQDRVTEIHDDLGGLFSTQRFLGLAYDSKTKLTEDFSWFENTDNLELLFNIQKHTARLDSIRKQQGLRAWWHERANVVRFKKILKAFAKLLRSNKVLPQVLATHYMRRSLNPLIMENVDLKVVCQFLSGNLATQKLIDSVTGGNKLSAEQLKSLESLKEKVRDQIGKADYGDTLKLLMDFSRYRKNLKLYRFAHRAFNRFSLRTAQDEIKLSKTAGTLYQLPTSAEIEEDEERICHHAILKADVRGSTTVTDELQNKGLNPASYFSMRFFNPINKILETYGAQKVFIEGDAIILSFLEYEHTPQQWFSTARACGYARDMLKIVGANNRYSSQMDLPLLELGVGICYSDAPPRFLYDGDTPIMISSAVGLSDRMSSCSWNLRKAIKKSLFNVDVLRIADGEQDKGEKGQNFLHYNVNGILIDDLAFSKLKNEIALKSVRMKLNGKDYLFHCGQYPDTTGRMKDLVIREGKVGVWQDNQILEDSEKDDSYFEVVVNRKVIPLVLEAFSGKQSASIS